MKIFSLLCLLGGVLLGCSPAKSPELKSPELKLIFDTDFGGDADDLGALAMLNHFQNKGEIELKAVMCWNLEKYAPSAIDAVNTYYGNPHIPIGRRQGAFHLTDWNHSKVIADQLSHTTTLENVPDATMLYRKILSESTDKSITLITVGPLMNIKLLMDSEPDHYSKLNGMDLMHLKIKELVVMGGNFPESEYEWNFDGNMNGVTKYVLEGVELPITYLGAEIGAAIKTGAIFNELPKDSPLYLGFFHFSKHAPWMNHLFKGQIIDNATFDQTAVLYAVRNGIGSYWHRSTPGVCLADSIGGNSWSPQEDSKHNYLILDKPIIEMEQELEAFMLGDF